MRIDDNNKDNGYNEKNEKDDPMKELENAMNEGNNNKKLDIASFKFSDGSRMSIVKSDFEKKVMDHTEKYTSFRVKYFDSSGIDFKYSYVNFYKNALKLCEHIAKLRNVNGIDIRNLLMELLYRTYKVKGIDETSVGTIVESGKFSEMEEFLRKSLIGAHYGYFAEDNYLKYGSTKYKFGRDFNLAKYYLVLIGDMEHEVLDEDAFPTGRLTPEQAAVIWNKDGTTVEEKAVYMRVLMNQIRKRYEPGYKDIITGWE